MISENFQNMWKYEIDYNNKFTTVNHELIGKMVLLVVMVSNYVSLLKNFRLSKLNSINNKWFHFYCSKKTGEHEIAFDSIQHVDEILKSKKVKQNNWSMRENIGNEKNLR